MRVHNLYDKQKVVHDGRLPAELRSYPALASTRPLAILLSLNCLSRSLLELSLAPRCRSVSLLAVPPLSVEFVLTEVSLVVDLIVLVVLHIVRIIYNVFKVAIFVVVPLILEAAVPLVLLSEASLIIERARYAR